MQPESVFPFGEGCVPHTQGPLVPSSVQKMEKEESKEEEESRSLPICLQNLHQLHLSSVPDSALYFVSRIPLVSRERMSLLQHQTSVTGMHNHLTKSSGQGTWGVRKHLVSLPEAQNIYSTHVRSSGLTVFK